MTNNLDSCKEVDVLLVEPSPSDLRRISPSALRLWQALIRARNRRDEVERGEYFLASLSKLARNAKIPSYATARAALQQLRKAGLVRTDRRYIRRWRPAINSEVNAAERLFYSVFGELKRRHGVTHVFFPQATWEAYVRECNEISRKKANVLGPAPVIITRVLEKGWAKKLAEDPRYAEDAGSIRLEKAYPAPSDFAKLKSNIIDLRPQESRSKFSNSIYSFLVTNVTKKPSENFSKTSNIDNEYSVKLDDSTLPRTGFSDSLRQAMDYLEGRGRKPFVYPSTPCPKTLPLCPIPPAPTLVLYVGDTMPDSQKALLVIEGYRSALRKIYGIEWKAFLKGDITNSKWYPAMLRCANEMLREAIPPAQWAEWRLAFLKNCVNRKTKRPLFSGPPSFVVVQSAKTVKERAAHFRSSFALPHQGIVISREHKEQYYRNNEVRYRWLFRGDEAQVWMRLPAWYQDLRRAEVMAGIMDPLENYKLVPKKVRVT